MSPISILSGSVLDVVKLNLQIDEFTYKFPKSKFINFLRGKQHRIAICHYLGTPAGFQICYTEDCQPWVNSWVLGVIPGFRRLGIGTLLIKDQESWAIHNKKFRIKADLNNKRTDMLILRLKQGYCITGIELHDDYLHSKIYLEKNLNQSK
jgi:GNAT superfamily N-acetyltransferase